MAFNSYIFVFVFLPCAFVAYQLVRRTRLANVILIAASAVFYLWYALWFAVPLLISSILDYFVARRMAEEDDTVRRRRLLIASVVVNLGLLSIFKYTGWISTELAAIAAMAGMSMGTVSLGLPPGISFYTFQTMSYTIDVYRGDFRPRRNFVDYLSFVSFFPQLVAGPIERASHLLSQLESVRPRVGAAAASSALFMILFGLFQKTVLADNFGGIVEHVQDLIGAGGPLAPGLGVVFVYAFAFQIYCDFAAYSTIARGVARLFSVDLMRNFATPYFSRNPSEFWERWHISLSRWLRDYLYIPLGGNRAGRWLTLRNLMITMVLGGLWHGAGLFFILWGLFHGLLLVFYRLVPVDAWLVGRFGRVGSILSIVLFFHLVCVGWIFFRATPDQFWPIVNSIVALPAEIVGAIGSVAGEFLSTGVAGALGAARQAAIDFIVQNRTFLVLSWGVVLFGLPLFVTDFLGWRRGCEFPDLFERMGWPLKSALILVLIYAIVFFAQRKANEFIYFAF